MLNKIKDDIVNFYKQFGTKPNTILMHPAKFNEIQAIAHFVPGYSTNDVNRILGLRIIVTPDVQDFEIAYVKYKG